MLRQWQAAATRARSWHSPSHTQGSQGTPFHERSHRNLSPAEGIGLGKHELAVHDVPTLRGTFHVSPRKHVSAPFREVRQIFQKL